MTLQPTSRADESALATKEPQAKVPAINETSKHSSDETKKIERRVWPEGATVKGRIVDHHGSPVANAEVLLLGDERVIVDAPSSKQRNQSSWFLLDRTKQPPASTRTNANGEFSLQRKAGAADRLAIIADDPLFWEVACRDLPQNGDLQITLPRSGSLSLVADLPAKPGGQNEQAAEIDLRTFDGVNWTPDLFRFHFGSFPLPTNGDNLFEHLPPAQFQRRAGRICSDGRQFSPYGHDGSATGHNPF